MRLAVSRETRIVWFESGVPLPSWSALCSASAASGVTVSSRSVEGSFAGSVVEIADLHHAAAVLGGAVGGIEQFNGGEAEGGR